MPTVRRGQPSPASPHVPSGSRSAGKDITAILFATITAILEPCDPDGRIGCFHLGDKNTARQSDHGIDLVWGLRGFPMTATYYRQARITLVTFGRLIQASPDCFRMARK